MIITVPIIVRVVLFIEYVPPPNRPGCRLLLYALVCFSACLPTSSLLFDADLPEADFLAQADFQVSNLKLLAFVFKLLLRGNCPVHLPPPLAVPLRSF
jgi:hypothetical protein